MRVFAQNHELGAETKPIGLILLSDGGAIQLANDRNNAFPTGKLNELADGHHQFSAVEKCICGCEMLQIPAMNSICCCYSCARSLQVHSMTRWLD